MFYYIGQAAELSDRVTQYVPPGEYRESFKAIDKALAKVTDIMERCNSLTGTDELLNEEQPIPAPAASTSRARRPAASAAEGVPPEKRTRVGNMQCHCGIQCTSQDDLDQHTTANHQAGRWICSWPDCNKPFGESQDCMEALQNSALEAISSYVW